MVCVYCAHSTKVTNSRSDRNRNKIWRRRACQQCNATVTTHETVDLSTSIVIEHSPRKLQAFSGDKLYVSIYESCKHRKNPIEDSRALTETVIAALLKNHLHNAKLTPNIIINTALAVLSRFDPVAATIYAAYHPTSLELAD